LSGKLYTYAQAGNAYRFSDGRTAFWSNEPGTEVRLGSIDFRIKAGTPLSFEEIRPEHTQILQLGEKRLAVIPGEKGTYRFRDLDSQQVYSSDSTGTGVEIESGKVFDIIPVDSKRIRLVEKAVESSHAADQWISLEGKSYEVVKDDSGWVLKDHDGKEWRSSGSALEMGGELYEIIEESPSRIRLEKSQKRNSRSVMGQTLKINRAFYEATAEPDGSYRFSNGTFQYKSDPVTRLVNIEGAISEVQIDTEGKSCKKNVVMNISMHLMI
jgi:hypothetical protein